MNMLPYNQEKKLNKAKYWKVQKSLWEQSKTLEQSW